MRTEIVRGVDLQDKAEGERWLVTPTIMGVLDDLSVRWSFFPPPCDTVSLALWSQQISVISLNIFQVLKPLLTVYL